MSYPIAARVIAAAEGASRPLFGTAEINGQKMLSIQQGQLDHRFFLNATIAQGFGDKSIESGKPGQVGNVGGNFVVRFHRSGSEIEFLRVNSGFRAAPGSPRAKAVEETYPDVVLAHVKIAKEDAAAGWMLIPAESLFANDLGNLKNMLADAYENKATQQKP